MARGACAAVWVVVVAMCFAAALQSTHPALKNSKFGPAVELLHISLQPAFSAWQTSTQRCNLWWSQSDPGAAVSQAGFSAASNRSDGSQPASASQPDTCSCQAASSEAAACQLSGAVRDCCCDYASVERVNRDTVNPLLRRLTATPFMRYFKVNLNCDCPFWPDDGMCAMRDCSVCELPDNEVPQLWKEAESQDAATCLTEPAAAAASVRRVDRGTQQRLLNIRGWRGFNNPWVPVDETDVEYAYINLQQNVERYTGYTGQAAHRIWDAIYTQSCFTNRQDETCTERRIFYRLISGMHASISAHIANDYQLDEFLGRWGPSLQQFQQRLGNPGARGYVENLYFSYLFTLRAVQKAAPLLQRLEYSTGASVEDRETAALVSQLVSSEALQKACPIPFHEGRLWKGADAADLRQQLQGHFQNITSIMDCVGCEKCKLWGKLQLMGIATSLKILFDSSDCGVDGSGADSAFHLERNEVIALFNLLERLSTSIEVVRAMSLQLLEGSGGVGLGAIQSVADTRPLFSQMFSKR